MEWSSVFNDTATYANYTMHIQKVCFFLGMSTAWFTPAVNHVAKGTMKCQGISFKFPNYIRSKLPLRPIRSESIRSEFAQACLISLLFSFMVPSGTLRLLLSFHDDRMAEFSPQRRKAVMGARSVNGHLYLVAKLSSRENLACGVITKRHCFCGLNTATARLACPVRSLWPAVQARVRPGGMLFSAVNRRNFNRRLKAILARLEAPTGRSLQLSRFSAWAGPGDERDWLSSLGYRLGWDAAF